MSGAGATAASDGGSYNATATTTQHGFGKPRRLELVFEKYDPPIYFITICSKRRRNCLANQSAHSAFLRYAEEGAPRGFAVGRYVIMPDHIHLFVAGTLDFDLGLWIRGMKRVVAAAVTGGRGMWQRGFFDHIIRNSESYSEKWQYVLENPVRAGLVERPEDWPYQGEVVFLEHRS